MKNKFPEKWNGVEDLKPFPLTERKAWLKFFPPAGAEDTISIDGVNYQRKYSGYTLREYYQHSSPVVGEGPGQSGNKQFQDLPVWGYDPFLTEPSEDGFAVLKGVPENILHYTWVEKGQEDIMKRKTLLGPEGDKFFQSKE